MTVAKYILYFVLSSIVTSIIILVLTSVVFYLM